MDKLNFVSNDCRNCIAYIELLQGATQPQKELIEQAAQVLAQDNTELACAFIQKTAVEKAIPEMDKRLATVRCMQHTFTVVIVKQ